jgi:hypothetical protein
VNAGVHCERGALRIRRNGIGLQSVSYGAHGAQSSMGSITKLAEPANKSPRTYVLSVYSSQIQESCKRSRRWGRACRQKKETVCMNAEFLESFRDV